MDTPRIYVASLSDYNAGRLHGIWTDVPSDADELRERISAMLSQSSESIAEEWAIHDYDGFPDLGEYPTIGQLCAVADVLREATENGNQAAFHAWLENNPYNAEHPERFRDAYIGEYADAAAYGYEWAQSSGLLAALAELNMDTYVDWDGYGRDLLCDYDTVFAPGGGIYVFDPNV